MVLEKLFLQVLLLSVMGSIVAVVILLIKAAFGKKLTGKFHYYIWFLLVLKLIIPLNFQTQLNPVKFISDKVQSYNIAPTVNQKILSITGINTAASPDRPQQSSVQKSNYNIPMTVNKEFGFNLETAALIWIIGVFLILSYMGFVTAMLWIKMNKKLNCSRKDVNEILQESKLKLGINSKISVIYDRGIKSPAVYGIIRPKILISERMLDRLSIQELKFVFLHELTHIKRKDLTINVVIMLLQAVYWFNPLILYALYQFKQDCELACDAAVLTELNSDEVREYGQTIINMLKVLSKPNLFTEALGFSNKYSKRRIIMLSSFNKKSIAGVALAVCLVFAAGCSSTSKDLNSTNPTANTTKSNVSNNSSADTAGTNTSSNNNSTTENLTNNSNESQQNSNSQTQLLQNIKNSASQGKIINSDFAVYTTSIGSVEEKLGKADREDLVPQIKDSKFYTYSKYNVVFGIKKGQVFEVRSYDSRLAQISLSMVEKFFGNPEYNVTVNGEKIIGYTTEVADKTATKENMIAKEYKVRIEFVFSKAASGNNNPILNHYFVLFPRGTANDMANDTGIQW